MARHLACPSTDQNHDLPNGVSVQPKILTPCEWASAISILYPLMIYAALTSVFGASQPISASEL